MPVFFYEKKGKRAYGSRDSKWSPLPTTPCNIRRDTGALSAFKVEIDELFEGTV